MKPILQALLLADYMYEDRRTGKKVLAGIFSSLLMVKGRPKEEAADNTLAEPAETGKRPLSNVEQAGSPWVYINLTELRGRTELKLRYVSLDKHEVLFETSPISVTSQSPLDSVEMILPIPSLPRVPGVYALELLSGDEPLGSHRITVRQMEQPK
ncbi:MAG TPA: hypothetical protein VJL29_14825 [Thermoguttaceae bacterium]|nr:hypothetical protein [Thermoguttaceae bacterium]